QDNHLQVRLGKYLCGNAVGSGEHAVLLRHAGKNFQRGQRFVAIASVVGVSMQAQERNSSRGIGSGRGRVLKRLASRRQRAQRSWWLLGIEETTAFSVVKADDHSVTDLLGKAEIAQVACRLVSI